MTKTPAELNLEAVEGINRGDSAPLVRLFRSEVPIQDEVRDYIAALLDSEAMTDWWLPMKRRLPGNPYASGNLDDLEYLLIGYRVASLRHHKVPRDDALERAAKEAGVAPRRAGDAYRDLRKNFHIKASGDSITLVPKDQNELE